MMCKINDIRKHTERKELHTILCPKMDISDDEEQEETGKIEVINQEPIINNTSSSGPGFTSSDWNNESETSHDHVLKPSVSNSVGASTEANTTLHINDSTNVLQTSDKTETKQNIAKPVVALKPFWEKDPDELKKDIESLKRDLERAQAVASRKRHRSSQVSI